MLMFNDDSPKNVSQHFIPDENDCRTCNMCVSHCPTFKIKPQQEESPRGRLKMISKILNEGATLSPEEQVHLNNCVECRACEKVCPSKMRYLKLLGKARDKLPSMPILPVVRSLLYFTSHHTTLLRFFKGLRLYQQSGLQDMANKLGLLKLTKTEKLHNMLPRMPEYKHLAKYYAATSDQRGSVGLFTGCLSNAMDNPTLHATIKVLNSLGYDVHVPQQQQCCGAIHKHNDDKATADQLAELNLRAFKRLNVDAIVFTASGCGSPLQQYKRRKLSDEIRPEVELFESKLKEINEFLADQAWPEHLTLEPINKRVAVHEPCSQRFPLGTHEKAYTFLQRIPGIDLIPLPENNICCGAGGTYMLTHTEMSNAIRAEKLNHLKDSNADILLTSNIGCALHLAAGINQENLDVVIAHPVELLAQQLK